MADRGVALQREGALGARLQGRRARPADAVAGDAPTDPQLKAAALALEAYFDEEVGPDMRRFASPLLCPDGREYAPATVPDRVQELREEFEARRGGQWVHEMYARHRGAPVAVGQ